MQAFILGAGLGTRLAPLTYILPKPLMPVFQKPLIHHTMDHYIRQGVDEFFVNISCLELMWERAFPEREYGGCPVHFSQEPKEPLDSGGGVKKILPRVRQDEPLLVHNGDILMDLPLDELRDIHLRGGYEVTLALRSVDGKKNVGFDSASGRVTDMRHALGVDPGSWSFAGIYMMNPGIAGLFPSEARFSIVPVWLELIRQGKVGGAVFDWVGWHEIGSPAAYLEAVLEMPSRDRIHASAVIDAEAEVSEDCMVGQGAVLPAGCVLEDCLVWPRTHVEPGTYCRCILTPRITVRL